MMHIVRRLVLALSLLAGIAPAMAQAPAPVPALPDVERRTSYSISGSTCACAVNFALYGDGIDYGNWLEVWVGGVLQNASTYTITSPSGPLANLARPITDAVLTFNSAQTGTVQIVGARRPRRTAQFSENRGVAARDLNQVLTDIIAQNRETWDKTNDVTGRAVLARPGETLALLPALASRQNMGACFDSSGNLTSCVAASSSTFSAGTGITFTGTNPTTISAAVVGSGLITVTGINPLTVACPTCSTLLQPTSVKTSNYTLATSDCGGTVQYGTGTTGLLTITLPSAAGFSEGCGITVVNGDSWSGGRGKSLSGFPTGFTNGQLILWPTQAGSVRVVNGAWVSVLRPGRPKLPSGTVNAYANFSLGSDIAGVTDGLVSGASAFKSIQTAMFMACQEFDLSANPQTQYTVNVAANITDTQGVHYACHAPTGAQGGAAIYVTGGSNATINVNNVDAFAVDTNAVVSINGITMQATGNVATAASTRPADCLRADYGGRVFHLTNTYVVCQGAQIAADQGGNVYVFSTYNINGSASNHFYAQNGGVITTGSQTSGFVAALVGANVTFGSGFAKAGPGGTINVPGWTWNYSGGPWTIVGTKAITTGAGSISGGSGTVACNNTFFPGTVNGAVASPFCS